MTVDDIYFAAINEEKEKLISLLEAREININVMLDCGITNGQHLKVPLLYSILNSVKAKGYNYEILDILIQYGVDLDAKITLSNEVFTKHIPLLAYVICDFKSFELTQYLLSKGANPNATRNDEYSDNHKEVYPLLYFALTKWETTSMAELLLKYGANSSAVVETYNQHVACSQWFPISFYAININKVNENFDVFWVDKESYSKLLLCFNYGAKIDHLLYTGKGYLNFNEYIQQNYAQFYNTLMSAYNARNMQPYQPICIDRNQFTKAEFLPTKQPVVSNENSATASQKESTPVPPTHTQKHQQTPIPQENKDDNLRNLVKEFVSFCSKNEGQYQRFIENSVVKKTSPWLLIISIVCLSISLVTFIGLKNLLFALLLPYTIVGVILIAIYIRLSTRRKKFAKESQQVANNLRQQYNKYISTINQFDNSSAEVKNNRWWNCFDALTIERKSTKEYLMWGPSERTVKELIDTYLNILCHSKRTLSGEQAEKFIENATANSTHSILYKSNINPTSTYKMGELFFWKIEDGTKVSSYETRVYSDDDIINELNDYNDTLDDKERFWNAIDGKYNMNNEERFLYSSDRDSTMYMLSKAERDSKLNNRAAKMYRQTETHYNVSNTNIFYQDFRSVGMVIMDNTGKLIALLMNNFPTQTEHFEVNMNKKVYSKNTRNVSKNMQEDRLNIIRALKYWKFDSPHPFSEKPSNLSDFEWAEFMFSAYSDKSEYNLEKTIQKAYQDAEHDKKWAIEYPQSKI